MSEHVEFSYVFVLLYHIFVLVFKLYPVLFYLLCFLFDEVSCFYLFCSMEESTIM